MGNWGDYQREETKRIEVGDHRVCISKVEETKSKVGNEMIVLTLVPSGSSIKISHYLVKNEHFNKNMTSFFDSFSADIEEGDFNFIKWIGAMGAVKLVEDDQGYLKVRYFLDKKKSEKLPAWEGDKPEKQEVSTLKEVEDDNTPWN